jgi:hypothetical protein
MISTGVICAPPRLVGETTDELAGLQHPAGETVAPGVVIHRFLYHDLLHPAGDIFPFHDRIADIFPTYPHSMLLELFRYIDDVADLIGHFARAGTYQIVSHRLPRCICFVMNNE